MTSHHQVELRRHSDAVGRILNTEDTTSVESQPLKFSMAALSGTSNPPLKDYQVQLMLLEQRHKKGLMMARQEQDNEALGGNSRPLGGPRAPPSRQTDLRHGLLSPAATPPNVCSLPPVNPWVNSEGYTISYDGNISSYQSHNVYRAIATKIQKDGQISRQAQANDYVPQKCTLAKCNEVRIFPTKASFRYEILFSIQFMTAYILTLP
jgi:hypothetical protein